MPQAKPKRRLKNLTVEFISLVDSGANKREVIFKNADADQHGVRVQKQITFRKTDEEKRLVYGTVYAPDESDAHGDTMTAEEIEKAAHEFLAAGKTNRVDKQHDNNPDKGLIVESAILKGEHPLFPEDPEGTWVVTIKVTDDETWKQVKKGKIKGISMEGFAEAEDLETDVEKAEFVLGSVKDYIDEKFKEIKKFFKSENMTNDERPMTEFTQVMKAIESKEIGIGDPVQKDFEASLGSEELRQAIYALDSSNWSAMHDEDVSDKKAALVKNAEQFIEHLNGLTVSKSNNQTKEDNPMSDENKEKPVEKSETATEKSPELEAIEKLTSTIKGLDERLQKVEKTAGVSKANQGQDEQHEEKITKGLKFI